MAGFRTTRVVEAFQGDFATTGIYGNKQSPALVSSEDYYITQYTTDGTEAQGDYIAIQVDTPENMIVDLDNSTVVCSDTMGTSVTIDISDNFASGTAGSAIDEDKYVDGLNISAGGDFRFSAAPGVAELNPETYITRRYDTSGNRVDLYSVSALTDSDMRSYLFAKIATATGTLTAARTVTFRIKMKIV